MSEPFLGQIITWGGNFAPRGWAFCDGQILPISQYTALFAILGTTYGGDGETNFALPDLRGRFPMHGGQGPGLSPRTLGERSGVESVALSPAQMPAHSHDLSASTSAGTTGTPAAGLALAAAQIYGPVPEPAERVALAATAVGSTGNGQPHTNRQPYLTVSFIIALQGLFPSRN